MKKLSGCKMGYRVITVLSSIALALVLAISVEQFGITSLAQSQGEVSVSSAKIRSDASASATVVGSAAQGDKVTINGQKQSSDGYTWYQIFVNADTLGYIRSDLVTITDGTTPSSISSDSSTSSNETTVSNTTANVEVEQVNPVSATVSGGQAVRVRANASTAGSIVTTVEGGVALTVTGRANGVDGKVWYQVNFISNGTEVSGFIRSDYVDLSEDLTPYTEPVEETPTEDDEIIPEEIVTVTKDWETQYDETWYLVDNVKSERYKIEDIFSAVENNQMMYENEHAKVKSQKAVVIILIILLIGLAGAVTVLIFKIKDIKDEAYYDAVEKEAIRRRTAERPANQKVMHNVGADKRPAAQGQRPASQGQRPASQGQRPAAPQGQRPVAGQGQRPAAPQGQRPVAGQGQRPAAGQGQRPVAGQGQRPVAGQGQRPVAGQGQRPVAGQGQRPAAGQGQRPAAPQSQSPVNQAQAPAARTQETVLQEDTIQVNESVQLQDTVQVQTPVEIKGKEMVNQPKSAASDSWKSKNFMTDDDEFEFEFLNNWDEDEIK